jgi:hypothetical protein
VATVVLVDYIDRHRDEFGVAPISTGRRQGHLEVIRQGHTDSYGVYGVREMHAVLNRRGPRSRFGGRSC